jgi:protein TonB
MESRVCHAVCEGCSYDLPKTSNMKAVETEPRTLDDLIFENRNHAYGAYAVRKAYPSSVNRATTITLGLAAAIAAWSFAAPSKRILPDVVPDRPTTMGGLVEILPELPPPPKPPDHAEVRHTAGDRPPVATANPVTEPAAIDEPNTFGGSGDDVIETPGAVSTGTGIETVEATPTVDENIYIGGVEVAAEYKGGMEALFKFVSRNIKYPAIARRMEIEGTVFVSFVVGKSGEIMDAQVIKGIHPSCDAEALRVINLMKDWSAGRQGGQPVKVRMVIPIKFMLNR